MLQISSLTNLTILIRISLRLFCSAYFPYLAHTHPLALRQLLFFFFFLSFFFLWIYPHLLPPRPSLSVIVHRKDDLKHAISAPLVLHCPIARCPRSRNTYLTSRFCACALRAILLPRLPAEDERGACWVFVCVYVWVCICTVCYWRVFGVADGVDGVGLRLRRLIRMGLVLWWRWWWCGLEGASLSMRRLCGFSFSDGEKKRGLRSEDDVVGEMLGVIGDSLLWLMVERIEIYVGLQ